MKIVRWSAFGIVCVTVPLAMLGAAFGVGMYAGAQRNRLFDIVMNNVTPILRSFSDAAGATAPPKLADTGVTLYDQTSIALAQTEQRPPANLDDWTGFYTIVTNEKELKGHHPLNPWLPPVIRARLRPWARAMMETTDGIADDTGQICQPTGMFRTTGFSGSFLFLPTRDKVVIIYGAIETAGVQRVYLNRAHPRNLRPSWNGDSVGYWEGDTLIVDTTGFNDKSWLHPTMEPHSEEAHLLQRIRRASNGAFIEVRYTVSDRKALTSAYSYSRYFKRVSDDMPEDICNDDLQEWRAFRNNALRRQLAIAQKVQ